MRVAVRTNLWVDYRNKPGVLRGVELEIAEGEVLGLVGQSGSGKTTFAMAALGLLEPGDARVYGNFVLGGIDVCGMQERDLRRYRGRLMSLIPQNPAAALNPAIRIGRQFREAWLAHAVDWQAKGLERTRSLLRACGLPADDEFLRRYPHQISIGQAQRVLISMALLHDPVLLIADEPTSALDLLTQREVLDLIARMTASGRMSTLFISHDLQAVASLCHRLAILHEGNVVECGPTSQVLSAPAHPYTRLLLSAVPKPQIADLQSRD